MAHVWTGAGKTPNVRCFFDTGTLAGPLGSWAGRQRRPCVFSRPLFAASWPAMASWRLPDLWRRLGPTVQIMVNEPPSKKLFGPYWSPGRFPEFWTFPPDLFRAEQIPASEIPQRLRDAEKAFYLSQNLAQYPDLLNDVHLELLEVDSSSATQNQNLWLGSSGVITSTHFDSFLNFNVQIVGRKSFLLFPPDFGAVDLQEFPFLHPAYAQSNRANLTSEMLENALERTLEPGDAIFIPSFWWHRVQALEDSINVNAWSYDLDQEAYAKLFELLEEMDLPSITSVQERMQTGKRVIEYLAQELLFSVDDSGEEDDGDDENEPARLFVQKLLRTRFQNIPVSEGSMDCSSSDVPLGKQRNDILAQMVRIGSKMQHKEIKLANLVESVAAKCVGVPHVHLYLKKCFA